MPFESPRWVGVVDKFEAEESRGGQQRDDQGGPCRRVLSVSGC
jgi:hypothetical protein